MESLLNNLNLLWQYIGKRRKKQLVLLILLMFFASIAEVLSIGAVLPFLGVITAPEKIFYNPHAQLVISWLGITEPEELLWPVTLMFCTASLLAGAVRLLLLWITTRLSFSIGADISFDIYRKTLYQPYLVHVGRNSSEIISGITTKVNAVIYQVINPLLISITSSIILVAIIGVLLFVDTMIALIALMGFGAIYFLIILATRKSLELNSRLIALNGTEVVKALQEGLGGIRDILIDGKQEAYSRIYKAADISLRKAQGINQFIGSSPRYMMEALGMVLIGLLAYNFTKHSNQIEGQIIPVLGALALGAQRVMPMLQQIYSSWSSIKGSQETIKDIVGLLEQPIRPVLATDNHLKTPFLCEIELCNLSFRYPDATPWVLKDINLKIKKGCRVGFIGATGSGKSTLMDVIMALLSPTSGFFKIDGRVINHDNCGQWQRSIAHVPQSIYLADSTIAENIAFGVPSPEIDMDQVKQAAKRANIASTIETWDLGYGTHVGERGIQLSGGQRQRIAIARALYKKANVIIFDEATSALDNETEKNVIDAIDSLDRELTILIVAHRLSTLSGCNKVIELSNGAIKRVANYSEISK
jgi:ABC-type multidrug transport system fused ATPase/permease subunit